MRTSSFLLSAVCAFGFASAALGASCVPTANIGGTDVPFTISVTNNKTHNVSYAGGLLGTPTASANGSTTWSGDAPQLFSDRQVALTTCPPGKLCNPLMQPFNAHQSDSLGVQIVATSSNTVKVNLTLKSWGNGKVSLTGTCDSVTGLLFGSGSWSPNSNNVIFVISFGSIIPPPR